ncbi:MAG: hypothetical protein EOM12_08685 [Verrucomicrobiae bacterium]|nr:hypothetical protein [Verrucomicrobiae bacterium]
MNTLNSFRRNERGSSSLKAAAILAAWALVSPWAFSAPAEGDQPEAEPQTQKQVFERKVEVRTQSQPDGKVQTRIWVNGKEVQPENKEGEISLQITGDPSDCAECSEACEEAKCAPAECESAQAILEKVEAALRSSGMDCEPILNMLRGTLKVQGDCPLKAPVPGEVQKDDLKSYMKELEKAGQERERVLKESREQMNRMLEKMGREPFGDWPSANISPRMLKMPAPEGDINARLERLEKRMQSLERPDAAVSPTMKELQRAASRIQNRVESKNMTAEEGLEKLLKRILGGQNSEKNSSQSEE